MKTIGIVANVYNEANALPGWLESATSFADHVAVLHAGPAGKFSTDGTIELLERWKIPVKFCAIDDGFGAVRTQAIRLSPCDYVMILDADERFHARASIMTCSGESTPAAEVDKILYDYGDPAQQVVQPYDAGIDFTACPSNWENLDRLGAKLTVSFGDAYNQGALLRSIIEHGGLDAVKCVRRHWHDFSFRRPTQNWHTDPDFQMRLVRNDESIYFASDVRMHERLVGATNVHQPNFTHGPFFDHYHLWFKKMEPVQRQHDVEVYNAVNEGRRPPTWEEFLEGRKKP